jgi:hypothetical protein
VVFPHHDGDLEPLRHQENPVETLEQQAWLAVASTVIAVLLIVLALA